MKTAINKTKKLTMVLIAIFTLGLTPAVFSKDTPPNLVELKSIGKLNKQPMFVLNMHNTQVEDFLVRVKDESGDLLYAEKLKGKNISRKYQIDITEEQLQSAFNVRFEITSLETHKTYVYNVTQNSHVVEDIIVAKL